MIRVSLCREIFINIVWQRSIVGYEGGGRLWIDFKYHITYNSIKYWAKSHPFMAYGNFKPNLPYLTEDEYKNIKVELHSNSNRICEAGGVCEVTGNVCFRNELQKGVNDKWMCCKVSPYSPYKYKLLLLLVCIFAVRSAKHALVGLFFLISKYGLTEITE